MPGGVRTCKTLRFLFASRPEVMGGVLGILYHCIATYRTKKVGFTRKAARTGVVTLLSTSAAR